MDKPLALCLKMRRPDTACWATCGPEILPTAKFARRERYLKRLSLPYSSLNLGFRMWSAHGFISMIFLAGMTASTECELNFSKSAIFSKAYCRQVQALVLL